MRKLWLMLTDARVRAVLNALGTAGAGIGDMAQAPAGAPAFFRPLRSALEAAKARPSSPAAGEALAAAEDFAARLEKVFGDMALLDAPPDAPVMEALLRLQQACGAAGALLSAGGRAAASAKLKACCSSGRRSLALARAAADAPGGDFPRNLKFSTIYSGLDAVFDSLERCAEALFRL